MKTILVTAFEPFGGEEINPSELVLGMLPDQIEGYSIRKLVLPVEYGISADITAAEYDRLQPSALIMLGQAGGRSAISIETTARNHADSNGPDMLRSTLPVDSLKEALESRGIPCEISDDAGGYVCNSLFYSMLRHSSETPTGFIHVPYIKEQGHTDKPYMDLSEIKAGIEALIEAVTYSL